MSRMTRAVAACAFMLTIMSAQAATLRNIANDGINYVVVVGEIVHGDADRFAQIAASINGPTVVVLNSKGGSVFEALRIGAAIRAKSYATAVASDNLCASACGLIWLGGATRYLGSSAHIGFHAAYIVNGDDKKEAGSGNAIVGAYLTRLGLSYVAVEFATSAPPDEMNWLHFADAQRLGVQCDLLPDPDPAPIQPPPAQAPPVAQALPDGSPVEHRMMDLVLSYYGMWSKPGADVEGLSQYYGASVSFYGSGISRAKLMDEKRKFAARWPMRQFEVKGSTLFVQCADTCSVTGVVEWDVSSVERRARSVGAANFVLKITPASSTVGGIILSENGSVLSNRTETLPTVPQASLPQSVSSVPIAAPSSQPVAMSPDQQAAAATIAYAEGRLARIDYEAWFGALPDGEYRDGVLFWAANRSLKTPPSCTPPGSVLGWQQGCAASRARLAASDPRRKTEKDYRWGWNSF